MHFIKIFILLILVSAGQVFAKGLCPSSLAKKSFGRLSVSRDFDSGDAVKYRGAFHNIINLFSGLGLNLDIKLKYISLGEAGSKCEFSDYSIIFSPPIYATSNEQNALAVFAHELGHVILNAFLPYRERNGRFNRIVGSYHELFSDTIAVIFSKNAKVMAFVDSSIDPWSGFSKTKDGKKINHQGRDFTEQISIDNWTPYHSYRLDYVFFDPVRSYVWHQYLAHNPPLEEIRHFLKSYIAAIRKHAQIRYRRGDVGSPNLEMARRLNREFIQILKQEFRR